MLDNVELIMYMKFQKLLMTGCRDMDKKHQNYPQNGGFPQFVTPQDFFKNRALPFLYPYGSLTSCKKSEKTNEWSLRYLKTDGPMDQRTTDGRTRAITKDPSGEPRVQKYNVVTQINWLIKSRCLDIC